MNDLSRITAVCVDTLNHELAVSACWKMAEHGFADVVLFTDEAAAPHLPSVAFNGFRIERIAPLVGRDAYSNYVLHTLPGHITTSHALIFQWDGFVLDASRWRPHYLEYDYVGAPFSWGPYGNRRVGNGGFSLRSAKLMRAVAAMAPDSTQPEDRVICEQLADRLEAEHGVRFAPVEVARHFAIDEMSFPHYRAREPQLFAEDTFGFHGFFNFHLAFDDFELLDVIDNRLGVSRGRWLLDFRGSMLMLLLLRAGRSAAAAEIAARCAPYLGIEPDRATVAEVVKRCSRNGADE